MLINAYYILKPLIPRWAQIAIRRRMVSHQRSRNVHRWPVWEQAGNPPPAWPGWPNGKKFALILTHDVELDFGVSQCDQLARIEEERGFFSTFAFVPIRYNHPEMVEPLRQSLIERGFSIIVHDLYHDGKLFLNRPLFDKRRPLINQYLKAWDTRGFASGAALHDLQWIGELDIDYSISTYDCDPFEPQGCSVGRIFPYWVQEPNSVRGYVEMPYTLAQDFTAFILMQEETDHLWRIKLDWIASKGGMALIKTHPDYMSFRQETNTKDRYPVKLYTDFLDYVNEQYREEAWIATPAEVANYWKEVGAGRPAGTSPIAFQDTFCATCQQAHGARWLHEYCVPGSAS